MTLVHRRDVMKALATPLLAGPFFAGLPRSMHAATDGGVDAATARTSSGLVIGNRVGAALAFKGIPYGGSTGGTNRFMPPTPTKPWQEPLHATQYGPASPQADPDHPRPGSEPESENCLTLNVWTPA